MRWIIALLASVIVLVAVAWLWAARHPEIARIEPPAQSAFTPEEIDFGETLVVFGGCASCHGAPQGAGLAGGRALQTPFGIIHATNITPDPETGIGTWSQDAFRRAMRQGLDRSGGYLYPAFPYDHFAKVTDADIRAIYAYVMTRPPIHAARKENGLVFPFNIRLLMAGWNLLFHDAQPFRPDPSHDDAWNRGAYLVEGLGHCAACHSPRKTLGARDRSRDYSGAMVEGWYSPALNAASPAPAPWTEGALINYLYDGWDNEHGIAAGPMKEVVEHTSILPEDDVRAIAAYLVSLQGPRSEIDAQLAAARDFALQVALLGPGPVDPPASDAEVRGLAIFKRHCGNCHKSGSESVPLALATAVAGPQPDNFLRVVIHGTKPNENAFFVRPMPAFPQLSDGDLTDLATFVRARFTESGPWLNLEPTLAGIRSAVP